MKAVKLTSLIICFVLLLGAGSLSAQTGVYINVGMYQESKTINNEEITQSLNLYIVGATDAFSAANAALAQYGRKPLFCKPPERSLTITSYKQIIDSLIESMEDNLKPETSLSMFLLAGLADAFPCD